MALKQLSLSGCLCLLKVHLVRKNQLKISVV